MAKAVDRADRVLADQGLAPTPDQAKRLIMAGQVFLVDDQTRTLVRKPGQQIALNACLEVQSPQRFVSRGGDKLFSGLTHFGLDVRDMVCLDAGASTGGFTDCLLQCGAARVYAVDVGHGQLHWKLTRHPQVVNLERVNLRHANADLLPENVDLVVADCSFISLKLILPACLQFLKDDGQILALIKPQFELAARQVLKGVVHCEDLRLQAVDDILTFARTRLGLHPHGVVAAGIKGQKGNQEYLVHLSRAPGLCQKPGFLIPSAN